MLAPDWSLYALINSQLLFILLFVQNYREQESLSQCNCKLLFWSLQLLLLHITNRKLKVSFDRTFGKENVCKCIIL